jgi:hypothetical protein
MFAEKETFMKIDHYTKTVLTIIALCLVWLCVRDSFVTRPVQATATQDVRIVGVEIPDPAKPIHRAHFESMKANNLTDTFRVSGASK